MIFPAINFHFFGGFPATFQLGIAAQLMQLAPWSMSADKTIPILRCPMELVNSSVNLIVGLEHFLFFHSVGNLIIPFDFHIFRG
jgi:hypothetical protein